MKPLLGNPAFHYRDFRLLCTGAACNALAMSGEQVVVGLLVFRLTGSSAWVGAALAVYFAPMLVLGVAAGAIADWIDRRRLLRLIELALGLILSLFALLLALGAVELWHVLALTLASGSVRALHHPARLSYAYDIVGGTQIVTGLAALNLVMRCGQLLGALIAGSAMQRLGADAAYVVLAGAHFLALGLFGRLREPGQAAETERSPLLENVKEYLVEMRRNRTLMMLIVVTAAVEVLGFSFSTALPELATTRLGVDAEGLGVMHAFRAFGGIAAGLVLAGASGLQRRGLCYLFVIYLFAASLALLAWAPSFVPALGALMLVAAMAAASDVLTQSMMQLSVPNRLRGRAMGAWVFALGSAPLGHLEMGLLGASLGVGNALALNALALLLIGIVTTIVAPRLRSL